jgi:ERCC4-type nuclease
MQMILPGNNFDDYCIDSVRLLECFGTVRACFDAAKSELLKVEGIGPKTAAKIYQVIN